MNFNKRIIQGGMLVVLLLVLVLSVVFTQQPKNDIEAGAEDVILQSGTAGVVNDMQFDMGNFSVVDLEIFNSQEVTSPEVSLEDSEVLLDDRFLSSAATQKADSEWADKLMVTVTDMALNVRAQASTEAEVVGKMFAGSSATVLAREGEWVKIQSGDVSGYVHSDYCVFGDDAKALAEEQGVYYAICITDNLCVRSMPSTDGELYTMIDKDSSLKVVVDAEEVEGWVAVEYNGTTAYVSAEFVEVSLVVGKAITMEEYAEQLAREQAEYEAALREQNKQQAAYLGATADEITLLAAIIYCEAGNQPYEGKLAVGAVVMNRVRSDRYPNDIYSVIYHTGQFAPVWNGTLAARLQDPAGIPSDCVAAAQEAISGVDNVNGALYFNNVRCGRTGLVIGDHVFW